MGHADRITASKQAEPLQASRQFQTIPKVNIVNSFLMMLFVLSLFRFFSSGSVFLAVIGASFLSGGAQAAPTDAYPQKPIQLLVSFAPGGTTDFMARTLADSLGKALGQSVNVVNKAGGGGVIGTAELAHAAPDGYSLGIATVSTLAANPAINPKVPYNPLTDFTPIVNVAASPNLIAVNPRFPAKNYKAFLAELKNSPDQYNYATSGAGGIGHLQMELYKSLTGVKINHVPFRGAGPALNDTVTGQVAMVFDNLPSAMPYIRDGRLIPIVVAAPERLPSLPNVPTFKEVGLESVNRMAFYGLYGPKGLPTDVVAKINAAVRKVVEDPTVRRRIEDSGSIVVANSPEQFAAQIRTEFEVYKRVVAQQKLLLN